MSSVLLGAIKLIHFTRLILVYTMVSSRSRGSVFLLALLFYGDYTSGVCAGSAVGTDFKTYVQLEAARRPDC